MSLICIYNMNSIDNKYEETIEVMKSRFVAIAYPLNKQEDFKDLLANVRKTHSKAKHVVYAYRVMDKSKSCDDQEPKGTAGRPLLELLHKRDFNNCVIFVARYYGGVKLGVSRLLRTYLQAGISVLNKIN